MAQGYSIKKEIGQRLRHYRERAGISEQELAMAVGITQSKLSKLELGRLRPSPEFIQAIARPLRIPAREKEALFESARSLFMEYQTWQIQMHGGGLAGLQSRVREQEHQAQTIRSFQMATIPGLLQTEEYARSVLGQAGAGQSDIEQAVRERLKRQTVLNDPQKGFYFVVSESALLSRIVSPGEMKAQLKHLKTLSSRRNITIGILPVNLDKLLWHSFVVFDEAEVRLETLTAGITLSDAMSIKTYLEHFEQLARVAHQF